MSSSEGEKEDYIPEHVRLAKLLQESGSELLHRIIVDPTFLQLACYNNLQETKQTGNYVICPIMLDLIMMAVRRGSKGETANEIVNSLKHVNLEERELKRAIRAFLYAIKDDTCLVISPVCKICVSYDNTIVRNFKILSELTFNIFVDVLNFGSPKKAAAEINNWVVSRTLSEVRNAFPEVFLKPTTKMVIVSTIYFVAYWNVDIDKAPTCKKQFFTAYTDDVVEVEYMHTLSHYNYYESEELGAQFLELKLGQEASSLVIVLPHEEGYHLHCLEDKLKDVLTLPDSNFKKELVRAEVPKFRISTLWECNRVLESLGIQKLFRENEADISGIAGNPGDLHMNHIMQKVIIRVDEEGVETASALNDQKNKPTPYATLQSAKVFIANHPFLFYLKIGDIIVFIGRVVNPNLFEC